MFGSHTDCHIFQRSSIIGAGYYIEVHLSHVHLCRGDTGDDYVTPHRTMIVAELLESKDIQRIDWSERTI